LCGIKICIEWLNGFLISFTCLNFFLFIKSGKGDTVKRMNSFNLKLRRNHSFFTSFLFSLGLYRNYSCSISLTPQKINVSPDFWEWLCGLTDGEGNFYIRRRSTDTSVYSFKFSIGVHVDDINMLIFIQKTLGFGKVYISGKVSYYEVYDLNNIAKIIEIFTKYSLNSRNIYEF